MNLKQINLNNWQSFRGDHSIPIPTGLVRITGLNRDHQGAITNRAGKTSLLNAIVGSLHGKTPLVSTVNKLINDQEKGGLIGLDFDNNTSVIRYLKYPKMGNAIQYKDKTITQEELERELGGISFDAFVAIVFFGTGYSEFLEKILKRPGEAKDLLTSLMPNLQIFDKALEWVKDQIESIGLQKEELIAKRSRMQGRLDQLNELNYGQKEQEWEASQKKIIDELTEAIKELQTSTPKQLNVDKVIEDKEGFDTNVNNLREEISKLGNEYEKLEFQLTTLNKNHRLIDTSLKSIETNICPTCRQSLPQNNNLLENYTKQLDKIEKDKLKAAGEMVAIKTELSIKNNSFKSLLNQKPIWEDKIKNVNIYLERIKSLNRLRNDLATTQKEINPWTGEEAKRQGLIEAEKENLNFIQDKLSKQEELLMYHNILQTTFGPKGIKSFVFDEIVFRLTDIAQQYLDFMTEGTIQIRFDPRKQKKTGGFTENIGLEVYNESDSRDFFTWSQSERKKVSLATSLAMNQLIREMFNCPFEFLIFDEAFDGLDEVGIELFVKLLKTMLKDIKTILVVTHNPFAEDLFDHTITVVKENNVSHIENTIKRKLKRG